MKNFNAANLLSVTIVGTSSAGMACLWLLDASIKSLALLAVGAVVCFLLCRASAATRHWIWATTLIGLIIMPAATLLLPEWRILPSWLSIESRLAETSLAAHPLPPDLTAYPVASNIQIASEIANSVAPLDAFVIQPANPTTNNVPGSNWPIAIRVNAHLLLTIWGAGVLLLLAPILLAFFRLKRMERESISHGTLDPLVQRRVAKAAEEIGVTLPRIIVGPAGAMPMVWSFVSARLLLPKNCDQWSAARLNAVLSHELIHLRRRDTVLYSLGLVARALNWFNPLAWYAVRQLRIECERACDDHVLRLGVDPSDYAGHLLEFSTGVRPARGTSSLAFAMAMKPNIEQRIASILDENLSRCGVTVRLAIALLVFVSCGAGVLATLRATVANEALTQANEDEVEIKYPYCVVEVDNLKPRSLGEAVKAFNLESQQSPTGVWQRPISEPETLAAIARSLKMTHVAESVKTILREIENTKMLPSKAYFRRFTRFDDERQMHGVWWVRLCIEGDDPPMYSVPIRTSHLFTRPYSQLERQQNSEEGVTLINRRSSYFEEPPHIRLADEFPQAAIDKLIATTRKGLTDKNIDALKALFDWQGAVLTEFVESELQMLMKATVHSIKFEPLRLNGNLLHWSGFRAYRPNLPVVGYLEIVYSHPDDPENAKKLSLELGKLDDEFRLVNYVAEEPKFPAGKLGLSMHGHNEQLADGVYQVTSLISNPGELISAHLANEEVWHRDYEHKREANRDARKAKAIEAGTINKRIPVGRIRVEEVVRFLERLYRERIDGAPGASGFFSIVPDNRTNSLLVVAQPDDIVRIEALVKSMDDNHAARKDEVAVETGAISKEIALVSSDVKEIVKTLTQFFGGREGRVSAFGLDDEQPTAQQLIDAVRVGGQPNTTGTTVAIVADRLANVLWAFALPEDIAKLEALIKQIDLLAADREFASNELIAIVGTEDVLARDLMVFVEPILEKNREGLSELHLKLLKAKVTRELLPQYVQMKALYQEFFRDMAGNRSAKEVAELQTKIKSKTAQIFRQKQIPLMLEKYKVDGIGGLEAKLKEKSQSIALYLKQFTERVLSAELERKYVADEFQFTQEELLAYYQAHQNDWLEGERARAKPFESVQREISNKLTNEKRKELLAAYHAKIVAQTRIWTLWPEDIPNSRRLPANSDSGDIKSQIAFIESTEATNRLKEANETLANDQNRMFVELRKTVPEVIIFWGEPVDGIRLGIRVFENSKRSTRFHHADWLRYEVWVNNQRTETIHIPRDPRDSRSPAVVGNGIDLLGSSMPFRRSIPSDQLDKLTISLEPGQSALLASPQTPIYPLDAVRGRYGAEPLRVAPGRYPLFAKVGLYALVGGISDRTRTDGKQLELQSGSIPIEVLQSAKMQFRKVSEFTETRTREVVAQDPASHVLELADLNGKKEVVLDDSTEVLIDEEDLESAVAVPDENNPPFYLIDLTLKSEIAPWFFKQTQELCDRPLDKPLLGIFISGKLISAPKLNSPIGAKAAITGRYTKEQAEELAKQLCPPKLTKPLPDQSRVRIWKIRVIESTTGKPIPGIKMRIQSVAKGQSSFGTFGTGLRQNAEPVETTSDENGVVSTVISDGDPHAVEVVSTDWWQIGKTLLDNDFISTIAKNGSSDPHPLIDIKLNRGQPFDSQIKSEVIR